MDYKKLPIINYRTFNVKSDKVQKLIRQALQIIEALGVPIDDLSERQKEKMAMAFLAVGDVKTSAGWKKIKDSNKEYSLTTRGIIAYENQYFEENISSGSYDDIKRKDLARLLLAMIVVNSKPGSNTSNPTRGYKINNEYSRIIKNYGQSDWFTQVEAFNKMHPTYRERVSTKREIPKLAELGFSDLTQSILPDVVAYSLKKDWIYLIEAYHTSNPITPQRKLELQQILGENAKRAIFITAFENNSVYHNCLEELAWETEVWIATEPDHMIHRNGFRFMGPYDDKAFNDRLQAYITKFERQD